MENTSQRFLPALMFLLASFSLHKSIAFPCSRSRFFSRPALFHTTKSLFGGSESRKGKESQVLEWEKFEFGDSPKWDSRFDSSQTVVAANEEELETVRQEEAIKDKETAAKLNRQQEAWELMSPELVKKATEVLLPYVQEARVERITSVLKQRTKHTRFLFENPANPSNVWACLRTIEAFGIQDVHVVVQSGMYKGKAALTQKRGMRTAMGSAQWMTLRNHLSTTEAVRHLKEKENCRILASDLSPSSVDVREINWEADDRPICIVMGNEERGISDEMRNLADETFTLPMVGFAESFNLSVATAIALAHLSAASTGSNTRGPLRPGDLSEDEFNYLLLRGLFLSVPQRRTAQALLRQNGIELPRETGLT